MRIVTVASSAGSGNEAASELLGQLDSDAAVVFVFAAVDQDLGAICARMQEHLPDSSVVGCTTMGEVGPAGFTKGAVSALAFGGPVKAAAQILVDLEDFEVRDAGRIVDELGAAIGSPVTPETHVLVTLTDGLSGLEELLVSSLALAAPGVRLVGGSAGDDFRFEATSIACGDQISTKGAVVVLLEPGVPFDVFRAQHYRPTDRRMVVTEADAVGRLVSELDGLPANEVIADALGVSLEELPDVITQRAVLGFGASDTPFLRTAMAVRDDGTLVMGGAVARGAVLTLMEGEGLVERTHEEVHRAITSLPTGAAGLLLFQCGGRQMEAESNGVTAELYEAMVQAPAAGFVTYGEQYGARQVNHTLTGLVLGEWDGG
ncbi:MAG: FIST C-terminal domain-containing protein [Proteobacteria bacterium]|nr:FIST C-terminal domain-containing protein [Pseudomonadota bacterium]